MAKKKKLGRPAGAATHKPRGLEIRRYAELSRANAVDKQPGYRRLVLETVDPDLAVRLQRLATLIRKKDPKLMKLLTPPKVKKKRSK